MKNKQQNTHIFNFFFYIPVIIRNPSIEDDTPFKSCKSSTEVFCQEISNDPKSSVTNNIKEQLHYDTWRDIEETYNGLRIVSEECGKGTCEAR